MKRFNMEVQPDRSYYGADERYNDIYAYEVNSYEIANGDWVKWEDVEREMIPIPEITITDVETVGSDPRERYLVELNRNFMGSFSDLERADARVTELKRILNIGSLEEDNSQFTASCRTKPFILEPRITKTR